ISASGVHGWPEAGMAQTRMVAPASGMPRELKTMSSLREPCACAGETAPGHTCSASVSNAHRNVIDLARLKPACAGRRDAIFDRIIAFLLARRSLLWLRRARKIREKFIGACGR